MLTKLIKNFYKPIFMNKRYYNNKVIDHFENPRNIGSFDKNDKNVGTGIVGSPACGDVMKLQIKVSNDIIIDAKTKIFGCGSAIASASYVTQLLIGKNINHMENIKNSDIANYLKLPPVKLHCSMLSENVIKASIKNYKEKK